MSRDDLEPWERVFHDRAVREQERRMGSVPDYGDEDLYGPGADDEDLDTCPNGCDLIGDPIPDAHRGLYGEGITHFSRAIGIYDMARDRTVEWLCPDCDVRWPR